jgi:crotonobetainyl-CoA:carnitine CoA-transferase CaiB-like acyl-CoA transferase
MTGALHGVKVLDLSRVLAGPYAAQMLGDLGADVIKVERPGRPGFSGGDDTRSWGPPWAETADGSRGNASYFYSANRNKRSLALDFHTEEGRAVLHRLFAWADVVVENYKPGDLARFGLDHLTICKQFPALVWCSITGFGHSSPDAHRAGYDFMIQAEGGLMDITGEPGGRPLRAGVAVADLTTGMMAVTAILAALHHKAHKRAAVDGGIVDAGQGQHIDMALFDVQLGWLANQASSWLMGGVEPTRMGNQHPSIVPYQDFETASRPIALAVGNDHQFAIFARLVGRPDWAADPRFATSAARAANRALLVPEVQAMLKTKPAETWLSLLSEAQVPAGPINTVRQALESPQAVARGLVVEQQHPVAGTVRTVAQPLALTATPPSYRRPPPEVGEHSREILAELGLAPDEVEALLAAGVVGA